MERKKTQATTAKLKKVQTEIKKTKDKLNKLMAEEERLTVQYQTESYEETLAYLKSASKNGKPDLEEMWKFLQSTYSPELKNSVSPSTGNSAPSEESTDDVEENSETEETSSTVPEQKISHYDPMAYIESKYCDVTSPNFCSYMTEDQRSIAYRNEKRMLQTGGKYSAGFARYDYALRNYKDVYTGGSRSTGYIRNTDKEKQYARSVVNQQISNLFSKNGISLSKQADLTFSIDPYTYQLTVSGNADRDTLSQIEKLLNEGDNAKNIWTHAWICMHDSDNEIVNSQANRTKANQYSLWHEVYETTGYDARNATYKNGTFIAEDGTDLLALFKEKSKNGAGYELYSNRWLEYAKNGWKKENDLVLKIGFDSSGLYDIGQERGYGATQNMWMKGISQSIFEASV